MENNVGDMEVLKSESRNLMKSTQDDIKVVKLCLDFRHTQMDPRPDIEDWSRNLSELCLDGLRKNVWLCL
jgi:hypothetical protein